METQEFDPTTEFDATVEGIIDALEPLGFESNVLCWDGSGPATSLMLDDGRCLDVTVKLRMWCSCCDLDGTHWPQKCDHPCCLDPRCTGETLEVVR